MTNPAPEPAESAATPRSRTAGWMIAGGGVVVIAVIALASGLATSGDTGTGTGTGTGDGGASAGGGHAVAVAEAATPGATSDGSSAAPIPAVVDPTSTSAPDLAPATEPGAAGVEVLPLADEKTGLPASEVLPDLVQNADPAEASARGQRVAGLPDVINPAPESTVTSSAVSVDDETITASLAATTSASAAKILEHYVTVFGAVGLSGTPATTADGSTVQTFHRGNDTVTVTIATASAGTNGYTLVALFTART